MISKIESFFRENIASRSAYDADLGSEVFLVHKEGLSLRISLLHILLSTSILGHPISLDSTNLGVHSHTLNLSTWRIKTPCLHLWS